MTQSATYTGMTLRTASAARRPVRQPSAIVAARAHNNSAGFVARSQYARKPVLLGLAEYAVGFGSLGFAAYLSIGM